MKVTAACSRISETTAGRSRWRVRLRRTSVLAVTAGVVLLAAACAGHPSTGTGGTSSAGGSAIQNVRLAVAQCMRSHGVPNVPDPDSIGLQVPPGMTQSHQFQMAYGSCESLLPPNAPVKGLTP